MMVWTRDPRAHDVSPGRAASEIEWVVFEVSEESVAMSGDPGEEQLPFESAESPEQAGPHHDVASPQECVLHFLPFLEE